MLRHLAGLAPGQRVADERAEPLGHRQAVRIGQPGCVALQVRLAQPVLGPAAEGGDAVTSQPEDGRDVGRDGPLYLGVPQHGAPALRQRQEAADDQRLRQAGRLPID